jgi:hypothetical protein
MAEHDQTDGERLAVIESELGHVKQEVERVGAMVAGLDKKLDRQYVSRAEFQPVQRLVYGFAALLLTGIVLCLLALVLRGGGGHTAG